LPGLTAAAALLTDYVLTVSVSTSALSKGEVIMVDIRVPAAWAGRLVRGEQVLVPHGDTVLRAGGEVLALLRPTAVLLAGR